ncbi:RHS repeat domain-containing protein [Aliikangiella sp. IMCC44359]|uniref:RHS repeat domain-containing protein n=1 Tax=Aliikangiella sp. IMCC44359 TaxID=3459125 RepID=UPI00403B15E5
MKNILRYSCIYFVLSTSTALALVKQELALEYNAQGQIDFIAYQIDNKEHIQSYQYNLAGAVKRINHQNTPVKCISNYNEAGLVTDWQVECNDNITESNHYDALGNLTQRSIKQSNNLWYRATMHGYDVSGFLSGYQYNGLGLGLQSGKSDSTKNKMVTYSVDYGYNQQGQLSLFNFNNHPINYRYDSQGNLTEHGAIEDMRALPSTEYTNGYHRDNWRYDELGRLKEDDAYRYFYDHSGRLKLIKDKHSLQIVEAYRYNASGKRLSSFKAKDNKLILNQLGAGSEILKQETYGFATLRKSDNTEPLKADAVKEFVGMNGNNVLTINHERNVDTNAYDEERQFTFVDRMGNPVVRWSNDDNNLIRNEYSPYGQQLFQNDTQKHRGAYGYTGVHSDDDTSLIYMQARYQNPTDGRFLTPDPARDFNPYLAHSYNLYHYTSNNPINAWDPSGLQEEGESPKEQTPDESEQDKAENSKVFYIGIYGANKKGYENQNLKALIEGKGGLMFKANHEVDIRNVVIGLKKAGYKVVLIGYSRGGNAAINVANALGRRKNGPVTIDQLITFDPHSLSDKKVFNLKYNNVKSAHNFYQRNKRTGGKLGFWGTNPYWGSQVESGHIQVQETSFTGHKRFPRKSYETDVSHLNIIRHSVNKFGQDIGL